MVRYAISTLEEFDINTLRVLLINQIYSKQTNTPLLLRVEDIQNKDEEKQKQIMEILNLFSIEYSQILEQKNNFKYHQQIAMQLLVDKKSFNCFCSDETLEEEKTKAKENKSEYFYNDFCQTLHDETVLNVNAPFRVRIKKSTQNIAFNDLVKSNQTFTPNQIDSVIILNQDKTPTLTFANGVDDMLSNVSVVIRDDKFLSSSAREIYIREQIGYTQEITYAHIPSVVSNEKILIKALIDEGFLPAAIANYLIYLGIETPHKFFTIEEAVGWFDISKVKSDISKFDIEELKIFNQHYIQEMEDLRLSKILSYADDDIGKLAKVFAKDTSSIHEIKNKIDLIFTSKATPEKYAEEFTQIKEFLSDAPFIEDYDELKTYITLQLGYKADSLNVPLQYLLLGQNIKIDMDEVYPYIRNYLGEIIC